MNISDYYTFMNFKSFYNWLDSNHKDKDEANLFIYKKIPLKKELPMKTQ